jgi:hypothetical protein
LEKGFTAKIFDKQCELHVIRIMSEGNPEDCGKDFSHGTSKRGLPRKNPIMNCTNTHAASAHLSVPDRLSFAEQMRYNQRAVKKFLSASRSELETGCIKRNGIKRG